MKANVVSINTPKKISIKEVELVCKSDEILVKSYASAICGTDKNYYLGNTPNRTKVKDPSHSGSEVHDDYPLLMGHEGAGEIVEIGSNVKEFKVGDRVMSFGWYNTMADYWVSKYRADAYGSIKIPEGLTMEEASLGEPSACAIYAGMNSGVELGDTVVIVGVGFAGQLISQVVKAKGAHKVICVDIVDGKLALAKKMGADIILNAKNDDVMNIVLEETNGYGADVVIEAGGTNETLNLSTQILKHGGILGLYSWILNPINLSIDRWHNDGFDIRTLALMHRIKHDRMWWVEKTLQNIANGMINIKPLITDVFNLDNANEAFETACYNEDALKVLIKS